MFDYEDILYLASQAIIIHAFQHKDRDIVFTLNGKASVHKPPQINNYAHFVR
jgi:hypothetical protein